MLHIVWIKLYKIYIHSAKSKTEKSPAKFVCFKTEKLAVRCSVSTDFTK